MKGRLKIKKGKYEIDTIVNIINNRPSKCLGYKTPAKVFTATKT
ncbi:transposase, IS30 family [Clostridium botulinum Ba4 str. 657]|uniref:Transposase, IS30 family n=1 Tax=Clostridium botulinum (strain 657 / Type Ba4) TaxID=515621 RepID=A0A3F2ZRJ8_CLOB6|nr:transposase, IS30 family [Clostridium botulinum Ba4 str. 657]